MKRVICICVSVWMFIQPLYASSYCVLSTDGDVLAEKNMHHTQSVASISKIMTAIIAIEEGDLSDSWLCSSNIMQAYGSMIYLKVGQEVSLQSLLYGLMLRSGNDAAIEIATHIAGDVETFVEKMNDKAKEIGMLNTTFHNPSGLDEQDGGNISSAYDMALLMRYAMQNEEFIKISGSQYYTSEWNYRWKNKNRLLFDYEYTTSGKTGYTKLAGRTLVTTAQNEKMSSIIVTLDMSDDFTFHKEQHTKILEEYENITVMEVGTYQIKNKILEVKQPLQISVNKKGKTKLQIFTHIEHDNFIVEVRKGMNTQVYTYNLQ